MPWTFLKQTRAKCTKSGGKSTVCVFYQTYTVTSCFLLEDAGPIIHVSALGLPIIIVNDANIATELLEKRATLYSDRAELPMAGQLSGWGPSTALLHYDDRLRAQRRHFHTFIGSRAALKRHESLLEHEARLLALRILHTPNMLDESVRTATGSVIMKITYGYDTGPANDPLVALVNEAMEHFADVTEPGKVWLVDFFPACTPILIHFIFASTSEK